jgi:hypothetical protein
MNAIFKLNLLTRKSTDKSESTTFERTTNERATKESRNMSAATKERSDKRAPRQKSAATKERRDTIA